MLRATFRSFIASLLLCGLVVVGAMAVSKAARPAGVYPFAAVDITLKGGYGRCSGVHIGDGRIITAGHCFARLAKPIDFAVTVNGAPAIIKWVDHANDAAELQTTAGGLPVVQFTCREPVIGEAVKAEGYNPDIGHVVTFGEVGSLKAPVNGKRADLFIHTAPIAGGFSGGPLYAADGKVIAINVAYLGGNSSFTYSSPLRAFCDRLRQ